MRHSSFDEIIVNSSRETRRWPTAALNPPFWSSVPGHAMCWILMLLYAFVGGWSATWPWNISKIRHGDGQTLGMRTASAVPPASNLVSYHAMAIKILLVSVALARMPVWRPLRGSGPSAAKPRTWTNSKRKWAKTSSLAVIYGDACNSTGPEVTLFGIWDAIVVNGKCKLE